MKRDWPVIIILIALALIVGFTEALPTQAAPDKDDTINITVERREVLSDGHGTAIAFIYDDKNNGSGADIICTAVTSYSANPSYGPYTAISCVELPSARIGR